MRAIWRSFRRNAPNVTFAARFSSDGNSMKPGLSCPGSLKELESIADELQTCS